MSNLLFDVDLTPQVKTTPLVNLRRQLNSTLKDWLNHEKHLPAPQYHAMIHDCLTSCLRELDENDSTASGGVFATDPADLQGFWEDFITLRICYAAMDRRSQHDYLENWKIRWDEEVLRGMEE